VTFTKSKKKEGQALPAPNVEDSSTWITPAGKAGRVTSGGPLLKLHDATPEGLTLNSTRWKVESATTATV
jgi:hypothetical protein